MGVRIDEDGHLIAGNVGVPSALVPAIEAFFRERFERAARDEAAGRGECQTTFRDLVVRIFRGQVISAAGCRLCHVVCVTDSARGARKLRREHTRELHRRPRRHVRPASGDEQEHRR